jgi:hypothetical protein
MHHDAWQQGLYTWAVYMYLAVKAVPSAGGPMPHATTPTAQCSTGPLGPGGLDDAAEAKQTHCSQARAQFRPEGGSQLCTCGGSSGGVRHMTMWCVPHTGGRPPPTQAGHCNPHTPCCPTEMQLVQLIVQHIHPEQCLMMGQPGRMQHPL